MAKLEMTMRPLPACAVLTLLLATALPLSACDKDKARTNTAASNPVAGQPPLPLTTPAAPVQAAEPADPCPSIGTLAETRGGVITPSGAHVVRLNTVCGAELMTAHLRSYGQGMRYMLVADDLRGGAEAPFELRLDPPSTGEAAVIGTLSFEALTGRNAARQPHSISYDVTRQIASLGVAGWPAQGLGVAIGAADAAAPNTSASIGALRLVAEAPR